jgi:N-methylhydantoinase A/oxoprolinase/acetone carboxylase beta subunit
MTKRKDDIRLGADIGGTFTDIALDIRGTIFSTKVLTNYSAPEPESPRPILALSSMAQRLRQTR